MPQIDALADTCPNVRNLIASGILPSDFVTMPANEATFWLEVAFDDLEAQKARIEDGIRALKLKMNRQRVAAPQSGTPSREYKRCRKLNSARV